MPQPLRSRVFPDSVKNTVQVIFRRVTALIMDVELGLMSQLEQLQPLFAGHESQSVEPDSCARRSARVYNQYMYPDASAHPRIGHHDWASTAAVPL